MKTRQTKKRTCVLLALVAALSASAPLDAGAAGGINTLKRVAGRVFRLLRPKPPAPQPTTAAPQPKPRDEGPELVSATAALARILPRHELDRNRVLPMILGRAVEEFYCKISGSPIEAAQSVIHELAEYKYSGDVPSAAEFVLAQVNAQTKLSPADSHEIARIGGKIEGGGLRVLSATERGLLVNDVAGRLKDLTPRERFAWVTQRVQESEELVDDICWYGDAWILAADLVGSTNRRATLAPFLRAIDAPCHAALDPVSGDAVCELKTAADLARQQPPAEGSIGLTRASWEALRPFLRVPDSREALVAELVPPSIWAHIDNCGSRMSSTTLAQKLVTAVLEENGPEGGRQGLAEMLEKNWCQPPRAAP